MNRISKSKFDEVKNKLVVAISFDPQTQKRVLAYGNLSYVDAIEHQISQTKSGYICIIADMPLFDKMVRFENEHNIQLNRISISETLGLIALEQKIQN